MENFVKFGPVYLNRQLYRYFPRPVAIRYP